MNLIIHQGYLVYFGDKYERPRLLGKKCIFPMCRMPREFAGFEEYCDRYQFDRCKLRCYAIRLFDFLNECFIVDKVFISFSYCGSYTGQKTYTSLKDHIK